MGFFRNFPYTNFHEMNLDWLLEEMEKLKLYVEQYTAINKVEYGGIWDITKQYPRWTIVSNGDTTWLSLQPVPVGIALENADYWQKMADLDPRIAGIIVKISEIENEISETNNNVSKIQNEITEIGNKMIKVFENVADMQRAQINVGTVAITKGFHNAEDGGFGIYVLTNDTPNGFDKLRCLNGCANLINGDGNIARYGAKNGENIDEIIDFAKTKKFLLVPIGKYYISRNHTIENVKIGGFNREQTEIIVTGTEKVAFTLGIHCTVENLSISSVEVGENTAFETVGSYDWFENVTVKNMKVAFNVKCNSVTILNVFTYNIFFCCVQVDSTDRDVVNLNITSCRFWGHENGGARGIAVGGSGHATEGLKVANTDIDFCDNGIEITRHFLEFEFVNVIVDQIYKNSIIIVSDGVESSGLSFTNCYFGRNTNVETPNYVGANIYGAGVLSSVKFTNCYFNRGNEATFRTVYLSGQDFKAWFISGCTFMAPVNGQPNLILDSISGLLVDKCYFPDNGTNYCANLANNKGLTGNKGNIDRCVCTDENKILVDPIYTRTNIYTV